MVQQLQELLLLSCCMCWFPRTTAVSDMSEDYCFPSAILRNMNSDSRLFWLRRNQKNPFKWATAEGLSVAGMKLWTWICVRFRHVWLNRSSVWTRHRAAFSRLVSKREDDGTGELWCGFRPCSAPALSGDIARFDARARQNVSVPIGSEPTIPIDWSTIGFYLAANQNGRCSLVFDGSCLHLFSVRFHPQHPISYSILVCEGSSKWRLMAGCRRPYVAAWCRLTSTFTSDLTNVIKPILMNLVTWLSDPLLALFGCHSNLLQFLSQSS